jgi:hypothetical protein
LVIRSRRARRRARAEAATRAWVGDVVRSGLGTPDQVRAQVTEAIAQDLPWCEPERTAREWIAEAQAAWQREAAAWPEVTDHDRLTRVFESLRSRGLLVLEGVADHWAVRSALDEAGPEVRGAVWFVPTDVWHAIDEGMLEVNLWHADGANAAEGEELLEEVLAAFADAELPARFDEGRVEVSAFWRRRPAYP